MNAATEIKGENVKILLDIQSFRTLISCVAIAAWNEPDAFIALEYSELYDKLVDNQLGEPYEQSQTKN